MKLPLFTLKPLALASVLALTACGGGGSGSGDQTKTGILVDSPVAGISYETPTQEGVTNAQGEFKYLAGEQITFFIGALEFPTTAAAQIITPIEMMGAIDASDRKVINVSRLLQTLDEDGNPENGITIPESAASSAPSIDLIDFSASTEGFSNDDDVINFVANSGSSNSELIDEEEAIAHLENSLEEYEDEIADAQDELNGESSSADEGEVSGDVVGDTDGFSLVGSWKIYDGEATDANIVVDFAEFTVDGDFLQISDDDGLEVFTGEYTLENGSFNLVLDDSDNEGNDITITVIDDTKFTITGDNDDDVQTFVRITEETVSRVPVAESLEGHWVAENGDLHLVRLGDEATSFVLLSTVDNDPYIEVGTIDSYDDATGTVTFTIESDSDENTGMSSATTITASNIEENSFDLDFDGTTYEFTRY